MGSGKSSVGKQVAAGLSRPFLDTDRLITQVAGMSIARLFETKGEAAFRDYETAAIRSLAIQHQAVIATGGGAVIREENRQLLRELGLVVWLDAEEETLFERVSQNRKRPLLHTPNPRATIAQLLADRRPLYEAVAHVRIDTTTLDHAQASREVLAAAKSKWPWIEQTSKPA